MNGSIRGRQLAVADTLEGEQPASRQMPFEVLYSNQIHSDPRHEHGACGAVTVGARSALAVSGPDDEHRAHT